MARVRRADPKTLFVLGRIGDTQGKDRDRETKSAHKSWKQLDPADVKLWHESSAHEPSENTVRELLDALFPGAPSAYEILPHGGGNLVHFGSKAAYSKALSQKLDCGLVLERAVGAVERRVWVPANQSSDEQLRLIQDALGATGVLCTLQGRVLSEKVPAFFFFF